MKIPIMNHMSARQANTTQDRWQPMLQTKLAPLLPRVLTTKVLRGMTSTKKIFATEKWTQRLFESLSKKRNWIRRLNPSLKKARLPRKFIAECDQPTQSGLAFLQALQNSVRMINRKPSGRSDNSPGAVSRAFRADQA